MGRYFFSIIFVSLLLTPESPAQSDNYVVKRTSFSSRIYDEFSPVFYKGGIVFCSDRSDNSVVSYKDDQNRLFKIFFITGRGNSGWNHPAILAREISTTFNDGPATFNESGNIIYYSRNNTIDNSLRNISDTSNKLGLYSAELKNGIWTNIKPFIYNNPKYSFSTPALTPNGDRIYFSSDMPGGKGGMDLYYCNRKNNDWDKPVNLGPVINTSKNESFPFACKYGKLFFSSDGLKGFGGKDLYYTQEINGEWIVPVHLDAPINSESDDFGLVIDSLFETGYFSTNREKTDDIFSFSLAPVEFTNCDSIQENNYCFTFYDEKQRLIDTIPVVYKWDFGNGIVRTGKEVKHCFPGPGSYSVKLTILDELTGDSIAKEVNYKVDLENIDQAYINSYDVGIVDKSISFEGVITDLKDFRTTDYLWNFGDGFKQGGPLMNTTFKKKGEYTVKLGLLSEKDSLGNIRKECIMKKIRIYNDFQELALKNESGEDKTIEKNDSLSEQSKSLAVRIYFMDDIAERQKAKIREALKRSGKLTIIFNRYGIDPVSYKVLDLFVAILKENPDIRLESVLNASPEKIPDKMETSEKWARELTYYFKNKDIDKTALGSKGYDLSNQVFKPLIPDGIVNEGTIEFIFMKN